MVNNGLTILYMYVEYGKVLNGQDAKTQIVTIPITLNTIFNVIVCALTPYSMFAKVHNYSTTSLTISIKYVANEPHTYPGTFCVIIGT